jgi:hypothetical protein
MLGFERRMVAALTKPSDPALRAGVERWVDDTLRDLPEHVRLGIVAESIGLGVWARVTGKADDELLASFERSPLWPVRQYVRLLGGLVIFAEQELGSSGAEVGA